MRQRVDVLERRVDDEAGLRAMMDRDISEVTTRLDAQRKMLQALAETQSEHTQMLRDHGQILTQHGLVLVQLGDKVDTLATSTAAGLQTIIGLLGRLEPGDDDEHGEEPVGQEF
jgi:hypothetical protein